MSLYDALREGSSRHESSKRGSSKYNFVGSSGSSSRLRVPSRTRADDDDDRRVVRIRGTSTPKKKAKTLAPEQVVEVDREEDLDRPWAYPPPRHGQDTHEHYRRPTIGEILIDLLLRMLEMAIAAAAQEIVYYFASRRFTPRHGGYVRS